jgi:hypothetical protein
MWAVQTAHPAFYLLHIAVDQRRHLPEGQRVIPLNLVIEFVFQYFRRRAIGCGPGQGAQDGLSFCQTPGTTVAFIDPGPSQSNFASLSQAPPFKCYQI